MAKQTISLQVELRQLPDRQHFEGEDPTVAQLRISLAMAEAIRWVSDGRGGLYTEKIRPPSDPAEHPDSRVVRDWLARTKRNSEDFGVIVWAASFVRSEWVMIPHRTQAQHRALFRRIAELASDLAKTMDDTGTPYVRGGGYGMEFMGVRSLLTGSEAAEFVSSCAHDMETQNRSDTVAGFMEHEPSLPTVQELLERVASAAQRLEKQGPLHAQPNKRGAERGYFVRRMGELFQRRYGEQPHEVIAALTTIALGEATDRELVTKLLA